MLTAETLAVYFWSFVALVIVVAVALFVLWYIIKSAVKRGIQESGVIVLLGSIDESVST